MFIVGAIVTTLLPLLPGAHGEVVTPTLPIGDRGVRLGRRAALRGSTGARARLGHPRLDRRRRAPDAVATHDTGGADSPARFLLMLVLVFAAYFFPAREAWPYLAARARAARAAVRLRPRPRSTSGLLGELLIVAPCYWLLAFLLITGKRGMIDAAGARRQLARTGPADRARQPPRAARGDGGRERGRASAC